MDNFKILYQILRTMEAALDKEDLDLADISAERFHISENRWCRLMKMLIDSGYIKGKKMKIRYAADGKLMLSISNPAITLKGLEYLEENTMMKKAYKVLKGIEDITPGI